MKYIGTYNIVITDLQHVVTQEGPFQDRYTIVHYLKFNLKACKI